MVLGCILCRQPLVTYSNLKEKKKQYLKGRPKPEKRDKTADAVKQEKIGGLNEIKEAQLVLSKCGHLFHKCCLKIYLAHQPNGNGTKRECPFCFKPVTLAQTIPIYLNVGSNDLLVEKVKAICRENDELHVKLTEIKAEYVKNSAELKEISEKISKCRHNVMVQSEEISQVQPFDSITKLKEELATKEKYVRRLTDQNSKLISLIEKQATRHQSEKSRVKGKQHFHKKHSDSPNKFKRNQKRSVQNGIVFNSVSLCNEYHNQIPVEDQIQDPSNLKSCKNRAQDIGDENISIRKTAFETNSFQKTIKTEEIRMPRHTPKGSKYLEYREKQLLAQDITDKLDTTEKHQEYYSEEDEFWNAMDRHITGQPKTGGSDTIRQVVELTRLKRLEKNCKSKLAQVFKS